MSQAQALGVHAMGSWLVTDTVWRQFPLKGVAGRPQSCLLVVQIRIQIGSRTVTDCEVPLRALRLIVPVNVCPPAVLTE